MPAFCMLIITRYAYAYAYAYAYKTIPQFLQINFFSSSA